MRKPAPTHTLIIQTADGVYRLAAKRTRYTSWDSPSSVKHYRRPSMALAAWCGFLFRYVNHGGLRAVHGYCVPSVELPAVLAGTQPLPIALPTITLDHPATTRTQTLDLLRELWGQAK